MFFHDLAKIRKMSFREAISFLTMYYWPWIVSLLLIVSLILFDVTANYGKKDSVMYAALINGIGDSTPIFDAYLTDAGYDPEKETISVDSYTINYENPGVQDATTLQTISSFFGMGNMDIFISDEECFGNFAVLGGFEDLRQVLPDYLLEDNEELLYIIKTEKGKLNLAGIRLSESNPFVTAGIYPAGTLIGIVSNTENMANAATFVRWMILDGEQ